MGEMIHLKLQPVEGNSTTSTRSITSTSSSIKSTTKKQRPQSIRSIWSRLVFPYTLDDWKVIMDEVKKLYLTRQYEQCAAQCTKVLNSITDPYRVHPLHSLFLSFYCATCLEITASDLTNNSPEKLLLRLRDSLSYFQKKQKIHSHTQIFLSKTMTCRQAIGHLRHHPHPVPRSSVDLHSHLLSRLTLLRVVTIQDPRNSRTFSESSMASIQSTQSTDTTATPNRPAPLRIKKKHCPHLYLTKVLTTTQALSKLSPVPFHLQSLPSRPIISSKYQVIISGLPLSQQQLTSYNLNLSSITTQLTYHITHISNLIDNIQNIRKSRRSNQPSFAPSLFNSPDGLSNEDRAEMERQDIRARIEKLRSGGWEKKRWDGSRYAALRQESIMN
ncbi:uncharacterized protein EAF02_003871 [Botrytis sinoallii]|uniref:uncharacterized protein n=1 Tax=Botrytis sinoallii TaxID=1463999 RepID=UPI00190009FA|nr:uncharacterized protein EAF02_003871 [Botrytis sinoallii]KAF7887224.1 hypothetical protein EAF02_003871 [Botrytis sinoallii]